MDLITTTDLEAALGRDLETDETDQAEYYIKMVSQCIIHYTGVSFELIENDTVRVRADYYGTIDLPGPVTDVTEVKYFNGGQPPFWEFDGLDQIYGLGPNVVVDITYDHGHSTVPDDIKQVATEVAKRVMLAPDGQVGPLFKYRVGDVEEMYAATFGGMGRGLFNDLEKMVLDTYRVTAKTYRLGTTHPDPPSIPESDTAIHE